MAARNMFSQSTVVARQVQPDQGIFEESSTQKAPLGTRVAFEDGRVFRYAKAGATALVAGRLMKPGAIVAQTHKLVEAAVAIGNNDVTLTTTSAITTATDGYLQINSGAGVGQQYKIKTCAANASTSTSTDLTLYDPITTALTTSSYGSVFYNPYEQVEVVTALADPVIGIAPIAVTAEYYFWLQTWGPAAAYNLGTATAGHLAFIGVKAAGCGVTNTLNQNAKPAYAKGATGVTFPFSFVGQFWQTGVQAYANMIYLMIAP